LGSFGFYHSQNYGGKKGNLKQMCKRPEKMYKRPLSEGERFIIIGKNEEITKSCEHFVFKQVPGCQTK